MIIRAGHIAHEVQRCQVQCNTLATDASTPLMGIGNGQLDAAQTAPSEIAPELRPEGLDLRWSDIHSEHFAPAVSVDAHR